MKESDPKDKTDLKCSEDVYRVFISYRHSDKSKVKNLVEILEENGLEPMWSQDLKPGGGFTQDIMDFIAHSHVFVPFLTKDSIERGWVNQEIGYAKALNIPILPICLEEIPSGMINDKHKLEWEENTEKLKNILSYEYFERLIVSEKPKPLFEIGNYHNERTQMIGDFSKSVLCMGYHGHIRQKARLSSFQIPDLPPNHQIWSERDNSGYDEHRFTLLRRERNLLNMHVEICGCSLIIDPIQTIDRNGNDIARVRIQLLIEYLEKIKNPNVKVAISSNLIQNVTMVGDWFGAMAVFLAAQRRGFIQTVFTRNAPTIRKMIKSFDDEIDNLLKEQGLSPEESKNHVIDELKNICDGL